MREVMQSNGEVVILPKDLGTEEGCKSVVNETLAAFGSNIFLLISLLTHLLAGLDSVINSAGAYVVKPLKELTLEEFNLPLKVDVAGSFLLAKYSLPHLEKTKGNMVFITSMCSKIVS